MFDDHDPSLSRRSLLRGFVGCSLAASPLITPMTFASAPTENRLVVLVLRGAMDGLDVVRPVGDPAYRALRPGLLEGQKSLDLDGYYALHPELAPLMPLWRAGTLGFAHAVSTPYRQKRSHFEGQDILEAGLSKLNGMDKPDSGWMNRLAGLLPGATARTAFAVGREGELILQGETPALAWYPQGRNSISAQAENLFELIYHDDPLFRDRGAQMFELLNDPASPTETGGSQQQKLASYMADQLLGETRLAAVSITGWDSHSNQRQAIKRPLSQLSEILLTLSERLGPVWGRTAVLAMTEFGRSAAENGTMGTDHGTGGAMILAGGALRGGRVFADWPGLEEVALYERRDLMPTLDVRALAGSAIRALTGVSQGDLERVVFPGLDMAGAPNIVV